MRRLLNSKLGEILFLLFFLGLLIAGGVFFFDSMFHWRFGLSAVSYFGAAMLSISGLPLGWYFYLKCLNERSVPSFQSAEIFDSQWRALFVIVLTFIFSAFYIAGSPLTGRAKAVFENIYLSYFLHGIAVAVAWYFSYKISHRLACIFFERKG